jgi:hypothetical protein
MAAHITIQTFLKGNTLQRSNQIESVPLGSKKERQLNDWEISPSKHRENISQTGAVDLED